MTRLRSELIPESRGGSWIELSGLRWRKESQALAATDICAVREVDAGYGVPTFGVIFPTTTRLLRRMPMTACAIARNGKQSHIPSGQGGHRGRQRVGDALA
jgi:hypothetical protein